MSAYATAPRAYKESSVLTAPPERLVVMLYDGARRFLFQAAKALRERDMPLANQRLRRAEAILDELLGTLDLSAGEVAVRLQSIYLYCKRSLMEARVEKSPRKVEEVSGLLGELREAWASIAGV